MIENFFKEIAVLSFTYAPHFRAFLPSFSLSAYSLFCIKVLEENKEIMEMTS